MLKRYLIRILIGALLIAGVSTLGDFIWAGLHLRHRPLYGLTHGTLLFLCIGVYLGVLAKQPYLGALAGAITSSCEASLPRSDLASPSTQFRGSGGRSILKVGITRSTFSVGQLRIYQVFRP